LKRGIYLFNYQTKDINRFYELISLFEDLKPIHDLIKVALEGHEEIKVNSYLESAMFRVRFIRTSKGSHICVEIVHNLCDYSLSWTEIDTFLSTYTARTIDIKAFGPVASEYLCSFTTFIGDYIYEDFNRRILAEMQPEVNILRS
jgi:hypothetical protein